MKKTVWKRPSMPAENKPAIGGVGAGLIVFGTMAAFSAGFAYQNGDPFTGILFSTASALISLGILMLALGLILKELRQTAFEAACRAGEIEEVDSVDPYKEYLKAEKKTLEQQR